MAVRLTLNSIDNTGVYNYHITGDLLASVNLTKIVKVSIVSKGTIPIRITALVDEKVVKFKISTEVKQWKVIVDNSILCITFLEYFNMDSELSVYRLGILPLIRTQSDDIISKGISSLKISDS